MHFTCLCVVSVHEQHDRERKFQRTNVPGTFVLGERKLQGTFLPKERKFQSMKLSYLGMKMPDTIKKL